MSAFHARPLNFILGIALLAGGMGVAVADVPSAGKRPNVLFVVCDDLSSRISPAGYEGVLTPVLDRLAGTATTFRRAYCQYPVCGPSRASFLSGLYPESTRILNNVDRLEVTQPDVTSLPKVFREAGYWTAAAGKVFHHPANNPGGDTWDQTLEFQNDEMEVERIAREKFEREHGPVTDPKNRKAWKEHLLAVAPQTRNQGVSGLGPGFGPTGLRDEQHNDGKSARQVASWITGHANGDRPFMIACGFHKPHIPFLAPDAYFAKYPREQLKPSPLKSDDWDDIPAMAATRQYREYGFPELGQEDDARRRGFMQAYYACISFVDAQLGLILDALHQSGQWENTIIVFIGDHGFHLGEHFMWGKATLFEESALMPMIVRVPGMTKGKSSQGLVEMVDIFPTLTELCGITPPAALQGRSFVAQLKDPAAPGKAYAYTVVTRGDQLGRGIRFDHWRYAEWGSPDQAELYDLNSDPKEFVNLVGQKAHAAVVSRARELLAEAERQAKAPGKLEPKRH